MAMKLYKQTFKGRSLADVQEEVGRSGGQLVRIDQEGESTTAYFEVDDRLKTMKGTDAKAVSLKEVTKI
jgi:hypothetical protein